MDSANPRPQPVERLRRSGQHGRFRAGEPASNRDGSRSDDGDGLTEETAGWSTRRREYPLPAQRGEGEYGEQKPFSSSRRLSCTLLSNFVVKASRILDTVARLSLPFHRRD